MRMVIVRCLMIFALLGLLIACSDGTPEATPQPTATAVPPTPTPTPEELVVRAARATLAAQTLQFSVAVSGAAVPADAFGLFTLSSLEGALRRPDALLATLTVNSSSGTTELKTVSLEGQQYLTNPITRGWLCLAPGEGFNPLALFDPQSGLEQVIQNEMQSITLVGVETLDGRGHHHLQGVIDGAQLLPLSGGNIGRGQVSVDLFADLESGRISRLLLADEGSSPETATNWEFNFTNFDQPVEVLAPVECP